MFFKRKAYARLLEWKEKYAGEYSILLEGPRRVGKSTIAEEFARREYKSYILIDFANASKAIVSCFEDISNLDMFFIRLQAATGVTLITHESVIIFDEIQLYPPARQAIKYLVKDGRYHYIETGSLISIKKNIENILIPSEEMKLQIASMDYEEFLCAIESLNYGTSYMLYEFGGAVGSQLNKKLMRDFRLYMAVGGMPQAVKAFVDKRNFAEIDTVKRSIIALYEDDFRKLDSSGRVSAMYHSIPAQLAMDTRRFVISTATGKATTSRDKNYVQDLIDSKTVIPCYNTADPRVSLSSTKDESRYKLYLADTGLFVTLMFIDRPVVENTLYEKLLSNNLPANFGYLYENAVAQIISASGRELYYHTWERPGSTHYYEVDFLVSSGAKINALEVKSSGVGKHESLKKFAQKYSDSTKDTIILSQKDVKKEGSIKFFPIYMAPFLLNAPTFTKAD